MQALKSYRNKAKIVALAAFALAVVFTIAYFGSVADAQEAYYKTVIDYSSLGSYAAEDLATAQNAAVPTAILAAISSAVSTVSFVLWMLANLLIAYKTPDKQE